MKNSTNLHTALKRTQKKLQQFHEELIRILTLPSPDASKLEDLEKLSEETAKSVAANDPDRKGGRSQESKAQAAAASAGAEAPAETRKLISLKDHGFKPVYKTNPVLKTDSEAARARKEKKNKKINDEWQKYERSQNAVLAEKSDKTANEIAQQNNLFLRRAMDDLETKHSTERANALEWDRQNYLRTHGSEMDTDSWHLAWETKLDSASHERLALIERRRESQEDAKAANVEWDEDEFSEKEAVYTRNRKLLQERRGNWSVKGKFTADQYRAKTAEEAARLRKQHEIKLANMADDLEAKSARLAAAEADAKASGKKFSHVIFEQEEDARDAKVERDTRLRNARAQVLRKMKRNAESGRLPDEDRASQTLEESKAYTKKTREAGKRYAEDTSRQLLLKREAHEEDLDYYYDLEKKEAQKVAKAEKAAETKRFRAEDKKFNLRVEAQARWNAAERELNDSRSEAKKQSIQTSQDMEEEEEEEEEEEDEEE
jgi:hypothetical protein